MTVDRPSALIVLFCIDDNFESGIVLDLARLAEFGLICDGQPGIYGSLTFERPARLFPGVLMLQSAIGAFSYVAQNSSIRFTKIGRYCSIGDGTVLGAGRHPVDWLSTSPLPYEDVFKGNSTDPSLSFPSYEPVTVGSDVWIGSRVGVMGGVTIGHGAIVGFGAVVTKDVPPYAIVGGAPARMIRYRFPEQLIERLLQFQWWRFDMVTLKAMGIRLAWTNPEQAIDQIAAVEASGKLKPINPRRLFTLQDNGHLAPTTAEAVAR